MARDIIITAGIKFDPKDVDTKAIRDAVVKTLANTELKIAKASFSRDARAVLQDSFSKMAFTVSKAKLDSNAKAQLQENFSRIEFVIQKARFGANAINNLKSSFQNLQITIGQAKLSAAAQKSVQSAASTGPAANAAVTTTQAAAQAAGDAATKFKLQNEALKGVLAGTTAADRATRNYLQSLIATAGSAETFGVKIGQITTRFAAYLVSLRAIFAVQQAFSASLRFIFEFDSALQDLQKVIRETPEGLQEISKQLFGISDRTGKAVTGVAASFNEFIRSGLGAEEALKRTEAAMIGVNVTGLTVEESTKLITSALTIFKEELKDGITAIDLLTVADEKAAASSAEIARGILRSGAAAESVGVSFKELNAITAATIEATQLSGSTIGAALKTIFANLAGNEQKLREQANAFGANIKAGDSFFSILEKLSKIFPKLGTEQVAVLNQLLAGKRRFTELTGLLGNFNKVNEILTAEQTATGVALQRNQIELQKLGTQAQLAVNAFQELIANVTGVGRGEEGIGSIRDTLKAALGVARDLADALNFIVDAVKGASIVGLELSSVFKTLIKAGIFTFGIDILKGIITGFKAFITSSNALTVSLNQNTQALQSQVSVVNQVGQAQQGVLNIERQRLALNQQIANLQIKRASPAAAPMSSGGVGAALGKELSGNARIAVGLALATAVQSLGDASARIAKEFESLAGFGSKVSGAFAEAASKGAELGVTFGFMLGPARGLAIGLTTAGISLLSFALKTEQASNKFLDAIEESAGKTVRLSDAQELFGERFGRATLQAQTGLERVGNVTLGFSTALEKAFEIQASASDNLGSQAEKLAKTLDDVRGKVLGTIRASELQKEINNVAKSFRERAGEINFKLKFGDLGAEFAPVTRNIAETQAALEEFVSPIKTTQDLFNGIAQANVVVKEVLAGSTRETSKILQDAGLISERLGEVLSKQEKFTREAATASKEFETAFQNRLKLRDTIDAEVEAQRKLVEQGKATGQNEAAIAQEEKRLIDLTQKREQLDKAIASAKASQKSIDEEIIKLEGEAAKIAEEDLKTVTKIAQSNNEIANETELITRGLEAQSKISGDQLKLLEQQVAKRTEILQQTLLGGTLAERAALQERQSRLDSENQISAAREERQRRINLLIERESAARKAGDADEVARLQKLRTEFEKVSEARISEVKQEFEVKLKATLDEEAFRNLQQIEQSLLQFRLNAIQQVTDREREATNRRIDFIRELGETVAGRRFIREEFDPSQQAARTFGLVGATIIDQLEGSTDTAIRGMLAKIDQLRVGGLHSFEELRKATENQAIAAQELETLTRQGADTTRLDEAKRKLEEANEAVKRLSAAGADAFEILAQTQEAQGEIIKLKEEEITSKREIILENLKGAAERVSEAENELVQARNKIPPLNAQVIEAEKKLASANQDVEEATNDLFKAYQSLADAQFRLNAEIGLAEFRARQATGGFSSASQQIASLQGIFNQLTSTIKASSGAILEVRRQIIQEELNLLQNQFNTVKSLAVEAATGGPEAASRIAQQVAAAQSIARGGSVNNVPPELLQGIERLFGVVDGLEEAVTKQGLAAIGLPTDTLDAIGGNIVELNKSLAESGKAQVDQAIEQVRLAQEALLKAEEQKTIAQEELILSRSVRDSAVRNAALAAENLGAVRFGFRESITTNLRELEKLEDVRSTIAEGQSAIQKIQGEALAQISQLRTISETQLGVLNKIASKSAVITTQAAPNAASGNISAFEFFSLLKAARKEKRAMPSGSELMLANTSEVVLTRRQAKQIGLTARSVPNAQDGNADITGLSGAASALTAASNALLNKLNQPGFVQQNITVQLDQQRKLEVQGLEGIQSAVKKAFEDRLVNVATKEEQEAVSDVVQSIVNRLNEQGIVNTQGF